jgi:SAM-dependent methyltransferase
VDPISKEEWASGAAHELSFWEHWLSSDGANWNDDFRRRMDPESPLWLDDRWVSLPSYGEFSVLDVGSGPMTSLGTRLPGVDLHVTAIDPLARDYNRLLDRLGLVPPVRTAPGEAENLVDAVGDRRFDVVICSNALDHSYDPLRALGQMLAVTKPGGHVLLYHVENEGEQEGYEGFHSWNFTIEGGRFLIWTPAERVFPDEKLKGIDSVDVERAGQWITVHFRKHAK